MIEELDIETYLYISTNKFGIYLFNKKNFSNLYKKEVEYKNETDLINLSELEKFLEDNIFKLEKSAGRFIKNIFLIIENNEITELNLGIKKKNYEKNINKKFLENILIDGKDLFRENYQSYNIMHILIIRFSENKNYHFSFNELFAADHLCVEIKFKYISNSFLSEINKILEKYQIQIKGCMDGSYIKNYFINEQIEFSEMIYKIQTGINENEVKLIPKNIKKTAFFEKFFQLFS
tara:strand:- start:610 stop:1314 length:705 start_codon:yes stop_codon:yes gene_type:complete